MTNDTPEMDPQDPQDHQASAAVEADDDASPSNMDEFLDIVKTVAIAVGVTLLFRFFLFQPFNIPSGSMKPTLLVGDFILVDKIEYGYSRASLIYPLTRMPIEGRLFAGAPEQGEIAVFKNANDRNRDYIKRVIGMPGDTVQMIQGRLWINGVQVQRVALPDYETDCGDRAIGAMVYEETLPNGTSHIIQECHGDRYGLDNTSQFVVPEGHYFMMGDNRDNSQDSRTDVVGYVPEDQVVGHATRIVFSFDLDPIGVRVGRLFDRIE